MPNIGKILLSMPITSNKANLTSTYFCIAESNNLLKINKKNSLKSLVLQN